jgi:hypothetical protein
LPTEVVQRTLLRTPFSREEEEAILNAGIRSNAATVSLADFERLLEAKAAVFHPGRTGRALLTHWHYLKQYSLFPEQSVQPIPKPDSTQHILNFQVGGEPPVPVPGTVTFIPPPQFDVVEKSSDHLIF